MNDLMKKTLILLPCAALLALSGCAVQSPGETRPGASADHGQVSMALSNDSDNASELRVLLTSTADGHVAVDETLVLEARSATTLTFDFSPGEYMVDVEARAAYAAEQANDGADAASESVASAAIQVQANTATMIEIVLDSAGKSAAAAAADTKASGEAAAGAGTEAETAANDAREDAVDEPADDAAAGDEPADDGADDSDDGDVIADAEGAIFGETEAEAGGGEQSDGEPSDGEPSDGEPSDEGQGDDEQSDEGDEGDDTDGGVSISISVSVEVTAGVDA